MLRELAVRQGQAYRAYGEALERFGEAKIGWAELMRTSGDIYYKEAGQAVRSVFRAGSDIYAWIQSIGGPKTIRSEAEAAPATKRAQRGRG